MARYLLLLLCGWRYVTFVVSLGYGDRWSVVQRGGLCLLFEFRFCFLGDFDVFYVCEGVLPVFIFFIGFC